MGSQRVNTGAGRVEPCRAAHGQEERSQGQSEHQEEEEDVKSLAAFCPGRSRSFFSGAALGAVWVHLGTIRQRRSGSEEILSARQDASILSSRQDPFSCFPCDGTPHENYHS